MFLRCSYFSPNLSLDVLIDLVLIQNNACRRSLGDLRNLLRISFEGLLCWKGYVILFQKENGSRSRIITEYKNTKF